MNLDEQVKRGQWADQLLKDARWEEVWTTYRLKIFSLIENAKTDEGTIRGKLMLGVANDVRTIFEGLIKTGAHVANEIKLEEEAKKKSFWSRAA